MQSTLGSTSQLLLPALVGCALLTIASSPARGQTMKTLHMSTEWGIDRPGPGAPLETQFEAANAAVCRRACSDEPKCNAYTFVYPGWQGPKGQCHLKPSVPDPAPNNCCISGVRGGWISGPYDLEQLVGEARIPLDLESSHVCVLTRISGKFAGGGESVRVVLGYGGRRWWLELDNHSDEPVAATAYCFWKGGFLANGPKRWNSPPPPFEAREHQAVSTWNGDAATFLSGVNGHLRGGGEHARIVQSTNASTPSELRVGSAAGYLKAWASSFFAGTAGSELPAKLGDEWECRWTNCVWDIAPTEAAMCYFTMLKGQFDGGGEWAEIAPAIDTKQWRLRAHAGGDKSVVAHARCYLRDQR
jgi:PAN domain